MSFEDSNFKDAEVQHCDFYHTRFVHCYFRGTSFSGTRFRGCLFDSCNFEGAKFHDCDFDYSEFIRSQVKYGQLSGCFPSWPNVLLRLARSLRKNAESLGDTDEYREFLSLELKASEQHDWNVVTKYDNYYQKYRVIERVRALRRLCFMKIERWVWGHGESWSRVMWTAAIVALVFAVLFRFTGAEIKNMPGSSFLNFVGLSVSNLTGLDYGNSAPANTWARLLIIGERGAGLVVFGFLVTTLYLKISRR